MAVLDTLTKQLNPKAAALLASADVRARAVRIGTGRLAGSSWPEAYSRTLRMLMRNASQGFNRANLPTLESANAPPDRLLRIAGGHS
jgi:ribosomal 50S subunit-associated protein YjgA (DUF615 family)